MTEADKANFRLVDNDGDGLINFRELVQLMQKLGHNPTLKVIKEVFAVVDDDKDDRINFDEFLRLVEAQQCAEKELETFRNMDVNEDGKITAQELYRFMGENVTMEQCRLLIADADMDGDGVSIRINIKY